MNGIILEKMGNVEEVRTDVFSRLLQNRVVFIDDLNDDRTAIDLVAVLLYLDNQSSEKITVFINSEGGDIRSTFAIYDAMKLLSCPIETFCIGSAMREAVLLLSAGTPGFRFIAKNADICLAQVVSPYVSQSDLTNTKINHDKVIKDNDSFLKELSKNTGKSLKELKVATERQKFLSPKQAVAFGIADKVV